jgi:hypothetical protein
LLEKLKLADVLKTVRMDDDDGDFLDAAAKLLNTMGIELLQCNSKVCQLTPFNIPS